MDPLHCWDEAKNFKKNWPETWLHNKTEEGFMVSMTNWSSWVFTVSRNPYAGWAAEVGRGVLADPFSS